MSNKDEAVVEDVVTIDELTSAEAELEKYRGLLGLAIQREADANIVRVRLEGVTKYLQLNMTRVLTARGEEKKGNPVKTKTVSLKEPKTK